MIKLGVNVDHVATIRQARGGLFPSPLTAARIAVESGADSITVHLREDRRHIQEHDVVEINTKVPCPLNLEMAAHPEIVRFALTHRPEKVCLVPERREELTTEGGLDVCRGKDALRPIVRALDEAGIEVSLFIDPVSAQIEAAHEIGARVIELHTGAFANATVEMRSRHVDELAQAADQAHLLGLRVHAGHGLDYENVRAMHSIPHLAELNIGHSIVAEAVVAGMASAVARMKDLVSKRELVR